MRGFASSECAKAAIRNATRLHPVANVTVRIEPSLVRKKESKYRGWRRLGFAVWLLCVAGTIAAFFGLASGGLIAGIIAIGGAIFWFVEYFFFFKPYLEEVDEKVRSNVLEEYKMTRQSLISMWVVLTFALTSFASSGKKTFSGTIDGKPIKIQEE